MLPQMQGCKYVIVERKMEIQKEIDWNLFSTDSLKHNHCAF